MVGAGLGPLVVAMITQKVFRDGSKVGIAMAIVTPLAAITAAIILGTARHRYAETIAGADQPSKI